MPNDADPPRVVIDESSFDFTGLTADRLSSLLHQLNEELTALRLAGCPAWKPPGFESVPCLGDDNLFAYLMSEPGSAIDRDIRYRFYSLIQKCPVWDGGGLDSAEVSLGGALATSAQSVAYALACALSGRGVACLVLASSPHKDFVLVGASGGQAHVYFFAESSALPAFWRSLYELENVPESLFFQLAKHAFPNLIFHASLSFGRFAGAYRELRTEVVKHLAVLNDHFLGVHAQAQGRPREIEMTLASYGLPRVSPESPKTHKNARAMRARCVEYDGRQVCCEWHSKIEGQRNRIHFAFGAELAGHILIGIFVDHLAT